MKQRNRNIKAPTLSFRPRTRQRPRGEISFSPVTLFNMHGVHAYKKNQGYSVIAVEIDNGQNSPDLDNNVTQFINHIKRRRTNLVLPRYTSPPSIKEIKEEINHETQLESPL